MEKLQNSALTLGTAVLLLTGCDNDDRPSSALRTERIEKAIGSRVEAAMEVDLLAEGSLQHWTVLDKIVGNAGVELQNEGGVKILAGEPISAIRYEGPWELPVTDYEITLEARRIDGPDFFAALTFPVNSLETCATFVPGGWGGSVTGISCIDGINASANETTSTYNYPTGTWFSFRIEVRPDVLKVWNGTAIIARVPLAGKKIGLRPGDIEYCAPLGLSTYMTDGEIRKLKIRMLNANPLWRRRVK